MDFSYVMIKTEVNLSIPRDTHGNHIVAVHGLLHVVCQGQELPLPDSGRDLPPTNIDIVVEVSSRSRVVECYILMIAECYENIFLIADPVEALRSFDICADSPMLRRNDLHGGGTRPEQGAKANNVTGLHYVEDGFSIETGRWNCVTFSPVGVSQFCSQFHRSSR